MTLFDYYARYMTELWEGKRPAPAGITLPEDGDEKARIQSLAQQLQAMGMAEFVRACAAQDGTVLPEELFSEHVDPNGLEFFLCGIRTRRKPRRSGPQLPIPMPTSTPSRCFWTASPWTTAWCSTSSTCSSAWIARNSSS